jgi:SAM-dependent methyltransferase
MASDARTSPVDLNSISTKLFQGERGIWFSHSNSPVSYPEDGNEFCFTVEESSFWFQHRNRCLIAAMERFPPPGTLFDIGGGNGIVSLALQNSGRPSVLVEPGIRGVRNAAERGIAHVVCSTLEDAGFAGQSLPAAGAFDVMEHIADDAGFIRLLVRLLAPGGRLYLMVPAFQTLWSQEDDEAGHHRRYRTDDLRRLLTDAGLTLEYLTYFFRVLPIPVFLLRSLPYRLGARHSTKDLRDRSAAQHFVPPPFRNLLDYLLQREVRLIGAGKTMGFGGSCLAIARKP